MLEKSEEEKESVWSRHEGSSIRVGDSTPAGRRGCMVKETGSIDSLSSPAEEAPVGLGGHLGKVTTSALIHGTGTWCF